MKYLHKGDLKYKELTSKPSPYYMGLCILATSDLPTQQIYVQTFLFFLKASLRDFYREKKIGEEYWVWRGKILGLRSFHTWVQLKPLNIKKKV